MELTITGKKGAPTLTVRMALVETTDADIDRRLSTLVSVVEKNSTDIIRVGADIAKVNELVSRAAMAADKAATTSEKNSSICQDIHASTEKIRNTQDRMMNSMTDLQNWQPSIDNSLKSIAKCVEGLTVRVSTLQSSSPAQARQAPGPVGRHIESTQQGVTSRVDWTQEDTLANGVSLTPHHTLEHGSPSNRHTRDHSHYHDRRDRDYNREFRMPKTNFPKFDGEHPKIWKEKSEKYFMMFHVPDEFKAPYATLHFIGNAALWLQTYEAQHDIESWPQLCVAVCNKFGKDLYFTQMNETLEIRQSTDVSTYYQQFQLLMHKLLTHNPSLDDTFFVAKFLKGLKKDIRSPIILHKPRTVDAALSLALLQETQLDAVSRKQYYKYEPKKWHNAAGMGLLGPNQAEAVVPDATKTAAATASEKFASLKAQRRARGECFKCGGKFSPGHKCPQNISLTVLEEICEALQLDTS